MMKNKKLLLFVIYMLVIIGFCLIQYHRYTNSLETLHPYEHSFFLSEPEDTVYLDLNDATAAQLAKIPGVSRPLADEIVAYRNGIGGFSTIQQLKYVPGFSESLYLAIEEYIYLTPICVTEPSIQTISPTTSNTERSTEPKTEAPTELLLNLNTASEEELCLLPGIGEVTAAAIVEYRNRIGLFTNRQELLDVQGIGEITLAGIKDYLYIEHEQPFPSPTEFIISTDPPEKEPMTESAQPTDIPIINLNTAAIDDLMLLPDCNETLATNIILLREAIHGFDNILEILYADGMTSDLYSKWKEKLAIDDYGNTQIKESASE